MPCLAWPAQKRPLWPAGAGSSLGYQDAQCAWSFFRAPRETGSPATAKPPLSLFIRSIVGVLIGSLREVEEAFRSAWCRETCDESDLNDWSPLNPSRGQCGVTALTLHDLFGGDLLLAEVHYPDGSMQGYHFWNRFSGGLEVDLTREQFDATEVVQEPRLFTRPAGLPTRGLEQYLRLQASVFKALGVDLPHQDAREGGPRGLLSVRLTPGES